MQSAVLSEKDHLGDESGLLLLLLHLLFFLHLDFSSELIHCDSHLKSRIQNWIGIWTPTPDGFLYSTLQRLLTDLLLSSLKCHHLLPACHCFSKNYDAQPTRQHRPVSRLRLTIQFTRNLSRLSNNDHHCFGRIGYKPSPKRFPF